MLTDPAQFGASSTWHSVALRTKHRMLMSEALAHTKNRLPWGDYDYIKYTVHYTISFIHACTSRSNFGAPICRHHVRMALRKRRVEQRQSDRGKHTQFFQQSNFTCAKANKGQTSIVSMKMLHHRIIATANETSHRRFMSSSVVFRERMLMLCVIAFNHKSSTKLRLAAVLECV